MNLQLNLQDGTIIPRIIFSAFLRITPYGAIAKTRSGRIVHHLGSLCVLNPVTSGYAYSVCGQAGIFLHLHVYPA